MHDDLARVGVYKGHRGDVLQLLCLGDILLSLGSDSKLSLWNVGQYEPQVCQDCSVFRITPVLMPD